MPSEASVSGANGLALRSFVKNERRRVKLVKLPAETVWTARNNRSVAVKRQNNSFRTKHIATRFWFGLGTAGVVTRPGFRSQESFGIASRGGRACREGRTRSHGTSSLQHKTIEAANLERYSRSCAASVEIGRASC